MTFEKRVQNKWIASILFGSIGFLIAQLLVWVMMSLVVFVALQLEAGPPRTLLLVVVQFLVGTVYLFAWAVRGMQSSSIDVTLRDAGPIERDLIQARITQEKEGK